MTTDEVNALVDPGMAVKAPVLEWLNSERVRENSPLYYFITKTNFILH
jgi:hypothetical protein